MSLWLIIKKHAKRLRQRKLIVLLVLLILAASHIGRMVVQFFIELKVHLTPHYFFVDLWRDLPGIVKQIWVYVVTIIPAIDLAIAILGLASFRRIAQFFIDDYWSRMGVYSSGVVKSIGWFYVQKTIIHLAYISWILVAYLLSLVLYQVFGMNSIWFFVLLVFIGYPAFYFTQSVVGLLAVLPLRNCERSCKLKYLYSVKAFKILYPFYAIRIGLEILLAFVLPLLLTHLNTLEFLVPWLVMLGLCVPFAFLRSLSFEIKLRIFAGDRKVQSLLKDESTS